MTFVINAVVLGSALAFSMPGGGSTRTKPPGNSAFQGGSCACAADFDTSGMVDGADLAMVLAGWGTASADLDGSGSTDGADLAIVLAAWGPCVVLPPNDLCANAIPIGVGVTPFCTFGASNSGPAFPQGSACIAFGFDSIDSDIWYSYKPTEFGTLTVSTCGTSWDTRLAVYHDAFLGPTTPCPTGGPDFVAIVGCNDDAPGCALASKTTFDVIPDTEYKIRVGGYIGGAGEGLLTLDFAGQGSTCEDAFDIGTISATEEVLFGNTSDNGVGPDVSPCGAGDTVAEWFKVIAGCSFQNPHLTVSTCDSGTDFDTVISVWKAGTSACIGDFVTCNDDFVDPTCLLNGLNRKSRVSFATDTGQAYYIRVSGYQGATGNFVLHLDETCQ